MNSPDGGDLPAPARPPTSDYRPTPSLPPPAAPAPTRSGLPRRNARFGIAAVVLIALRGGREALGRNFGVTGVLIGIGMFLAFLVVWRVIVAQRRKRGGGSEYTPEMIRQQFAKSGAAAPAFEEDGTLSGASLYAVNQKSKVIEVSGEYEIFASTGARLGSVHQIGQGRFKRLVRLLGSWDQFFTHHFEIHGVEGETLLRVTRPAKLFKSRLEVFDGNNQFIGRVVQQNVFGKIDFAIYGPAGETLGAMRAENWRAWDFRVESVSGHEVARITKTFEGVARTLLSTADTYVVRVHQRLGDPFRALVHATALTVDVALKQDARGLGA